MLRRNKGEVAESRGDQQYLLLFSRPPDVKRTTFRVEKHVESEDDRWLYLPGLDLVKRIAASDERTSFMGSHLFYEDLSGRSTVADKHTLEEVTETSYVIKSVPRLRGAVEFAEYTAWIDKSNFLPMKFEYKDDTGKVYRRITATKVEEFSGIPTVTEMKVEDLRSEGYTVIQMRFIKYDIALPDSIFSERSLRNPPMKWFARSGA
jgi:outer membrane lipoprotein-sorting protein